MKNYITYELINSPIRRCGGYGKANGCTEEQTAFGNYLYAIQLLSGTYNHPNKVYAQGKIDMAKDVLEDIAHACIDKDNMKVNFDDKTFVKNYATGYLFSIGGLMPYVIQYVALKDGLAFEFNNDNGYSLNNVDLKKVEPVKDEDMIKSVVVTLNVQRAKTREENPELKFNKNYQPLPLNDYIPDENATNKHL